MMDIYMDTPRIGIQAGHHLAAHLAPRLPVYLFAHLYLSRRRLASRISNQTQCHPCSQPTLVFLR